MDEKTVAKLLDGVGRDPLHDVLLIAILALILAILVVKFVRDHLRKTSGSSSSPATVACPHKIELTAIQAGLDHLTTLHAPTDSDGVPRWYFKASMAQSIADTEDTVVRIERELGELKKRCERCDLYSRRGSP